MAKVSNTSQVFFCSSLVKHKPTAAPQGDQNQSKKALLNTINTKQKQNYFLAVKRFPCKLAYLNVWQSNRCLSCGLHNHILPLPLGAGWDVVSSRITADQKQVPLLPGGADFRGAGAVVTATGHIQQLQDEAGVAHNALGHEHHIARAQRCSYLECKRVKAGKQVLKMTKFWSQCAKWRGGGLCKY